MKIYFTAFSLLLSQTIFAQSFTLLPNSATSNALNTTANKVGINIGNPNAELHINRAGNVNTQIQFTNGATGTNSINGLWFGIDEQGGAILRNRKLNSDFRIELNEAGNFGNNIYLFNDDFRTNRSIASYSRVFVQDTSQTLNNNSSYTLGAFSNNNTVELLLETKGQISASQFSLRRYPAASNVVKQNVSMAGQTVFENTDQYNTGSFIFLDSKVRALANNTESYISSTRMAINVAPNDNFENTLEVNGNARIGVNGNSITAINNEELEVDLPSIAAGSTHTQSFPFANITKERNTVLVSPNVALPSGFIIAQARVSANNTVEITFANLSSSSIDLPRGIFNCTVITFPFIP